MIDEAQIWSMHVGKQAKTQEPSKLSSSQEDSCYTLTLVLAGARRGEDTKGCAK